MLHLMWACVWGGSVGERVRVDVRVSVSERGRSRRVSRGGGRAWRGGVAWARECVSVRARGRSLMHRIRVTLHAGCYC